jgi:hypothetical protein
MGTAAWAGWRQGKILGPLLGIIAAPVEAVDGLVEQVRLSLTMV